MPRQLPHFSSAAVFTNNVISHTKIVNGKISNYTKENNNISSSYGDNFSNPYSSNASLHRNYVYSGLHENGIHVDASNVTRLTNTVMHGQNDSRLFDMLYYGSVY